MGERQALELREGLEEVLGEPAECVVVDLVLRIESAVAVVDRVVAAPEDPAVIGRPVVVELVAGIADSLAGVPADRRPLRRAQGSVTSA